MEGGHQIRELKYIIGGYRMLTDEREITLNNVRYIRYDIFNDNLNIITGLKAQIAKLEGTISNQDKETSRFFIHSEPHLFNYTHYSIDAVDIIEARDKFYAYLDTIIGEIYPTQSVVDAEKINTSIFDHPFGDSEYLHIE